MKKIIVLLILAMSLGVSDEVSDILNNLRANVFLSSDNAWMEDILDEENTDETIKDINRSEMMGVLNKYHMSKGYRNEIAEAIEYTSFEFGISKRLLLASCIKESSINPNVKHEYVKVLVWKDETRKERVKVKTRALGLNGVIFEIHKFRLEKIGINKKTDLYKPINSLRAMANIITDYKKLRIVEGAKNKTESALMRYYGIINTPKGRKVAVNYMKDVLAKRG